MGMTGFDIMREALDSVRVMTFIEFVNGEQQLAMAA